MDHQIPQLSVFFPAYNEEDNLENTITKAIPVLKKNVSQFEVIIIDDGSRDNTGEIADKLSRQYPFIKVVHHNPNKGYGAAIKSGMYGAKYPWIIFTDADGQFDFSELTLFWEKQQQTKADLVIGYYLKRQVSKTVILTSEIWEFLIFLMFGLKVRDIDCGFKLFRKKVVDTIPKLESERGPFITSEYLIKAKAKGFKIAEVGVHHYPRTAGKATGRSFKVILSGFKDLFRLRKKLFYA